MPLKSKDRPTFYYKMDGELYTIRAGGVLFYKKVDDYVKLLMIRNRGKLEDFGGCTDVMDTDIYDTFSREVEEESNKVFNKEDIKKRLGGLEPIMIKISKYLLFLMPLTEEEKKLKEADFGSIEFHDDINRTVEWIDAEKFNDIEFQNELNFRLRINSLKNLNIWK